MPGESRAETVDFGSPNPPFVVRGGGGGVKYDFLRFRLIFYGMKIFKFV